MLHLTYFVLPGFICSSWNIRHVVTNLFLFTLFKILIKKYWNKRARYAFKDLVASKKRRRSGSGITKRLPYCRNLAQVKAWFPQLQASEARWLELEKSQIQGHQLYDLLLASRLHSYSNSNLSPTVATLQAWKVFSSMQLGGTATKPLPFTLASIAMLIPDIHISHWVSKGIITTEDLMIGPTLKTFRAVQLKYGIKDHDHYRYLQISNFLHTNPHSTTYLPWRAVLYFTNPSTKIKGISLFYNMLHNKNKFTKSRTVKA